MSKRMPIMLDNGKVFSTQSAAINYFKDILNSVSSETNINFENPLFSDLMSLYKRHPEFELKSESESNIVGFIIKNSGQFNTKCFHAVHRDNSLADWGYRIAIKSEHKTPLNCFIDAARFSLEQEYSYFRDENFKKKCKVFIKVMGVDDELVPKEWISQPNKLQYRSSLVEPIKKHFLSWYAECFMSTS